MSDLGLLSYRSFWADTLIEILANAKHELSISDLSDMTAFTQDDIMLTLQSMDMIKYYKNQFVIYLDEKQMEQLEKLRSKTKETIDPRCLDWVIANLL